MERIRRISPWLIFVVYTLVVVATSRLLVYFSLPNELMTFLLVPILLVGVVHPRRVHWAMALVMFIGALLVIYRSSQFTWIPVSINAASIITMLAVIEILRMVYIRRNQAETLLKTQRDLATALGSMNSLNKALDKILEAACSIEGIDAGGIRLVDQVTGDAVLTAYHGQLSAQIIENLSHLPSTLSQIQTLTDGHPVYQPYSSFLSAMGSTLDPSGNLRAAAIIPVLEQGKIIAALILASHTLDKIPNTSQQALETIAAQVGDVIARIRGETAVQESQKNFQSVFDTLDDFLFIINEGGTILHYNPIVINRLGYSAEELNQMNLLDLRPPDLRENASQAFVEILAGERTTCQCPLYKKDGSLIPVETRVVRGRWNNQEVLFAISRDITEREQAEAALQKSEELFRTVIENQGEGLAIVDRDENFSFANPAADIIFGVPPGSLAGRNLREFVSPDQINIVLDETQKRLKGERSSYELNILRPDAESRSILITVTPRIDKGGTFNGSFGIFRDITERKAAEEALRESEQRFRNLIEQSQDSIALIDEMGFVIEWNQANEQLTGLKRENAVGKPYWDVLFNLTLPDKSQTRYEQLKNMVLTGVKSGEGSFLYLPMETIYHGADGVKRVTTQTIFPIKTQMGYQIGVISHDITERKKIEEELRRANNELTHWLLELEARNKETMLLKEMGDLLHSCHEVEEAYQVFDQLIQQLFPNTSGTLYTFLNSENSLEAVTVWGDALDGNQPINKDDCWGLRRGQVHRVDDPRRGMLCPHVHLSGACSSVCVPLVAQSETIGLLHIQFWEANRPEGLDQKSWMDSLESLAVTMADQVGMALANLKMHRLLNDQINHDTLTGLFNRKYIEETLQREVHRVVRQKGQLGIMLLDLDHLTEINVLFGQATGNEVLVTFAGLLNDLIKPGEIPCRYGGDIFALLLPDATIQETCQRAEEVCKATKNMVIEIMGRSIGPITLSVGVAAFPDHGQESEFILQSAELALTLAKAEGHDRVKVL